MKKHAYLIMAYNNPQQLVKLIEVVDDERNDIYVHIDADSDFPVEQISDVAVKSKLYIIDRISIMWADYSQVEAEMRLLKSATLNDTYHYYHLLSGMDFPLKTQNEIHSFFDDKKAEFIGIVSNGDLPYHLKHVKYYYPLLRIKSFRKSKFLKLFNEVLVFCEKCIGVNRIKKFKGYSFYDGWTWFSITDDFARYLLNHEDVILEIFKYSKAPDEMVLQTMAMNSEFSNKLYDKGNLQNGSMRKICWSRGKPYTWQEKDFDELINSPYMFARKFEQCENAGGYT